MRLLHTDMNPDDVQTLVENSENLGTTYLGTRESTMGVEENVGVSSQNRLMHVLTIGPTGAGKTQMMVHAALQDATSGNGMCFLTPKGDAIDQILSKLPEDRMDDVVYINPNEKPVTKINVLEPHIHDDMTEAQLENQKEIIVSDVVEMFRRHSKEWGDRFGRILETLLRAHLDLNIQYGESNTLLDVYNCIIDDDKLQELIDKTDNEYLRNQLVRITQLSDRELDPLHRRLDDYVTNATVQRVIDTDSSAVDFSEVVNDGKILLIEVQKGEVGGTVADMVGSMAITQIWAAAEARISQPEHERDPFYLFVDEVSNFAGEGSNFATILSEAREYKLGCWLASQYLAQIPSEMRKAVINNCRTKIFFDPSASEDLAQIANMMHGVDKGQLKNLRQYQAVMQQPQSDYSGAVAFYTFPPWTSDRDKEVVEQMKQEGTVVGDQSTASVDELLSLGPAGNAGEQVHTSLLQDAKAYLESRPAVEQVNLLHQNPGDDRPDGHVLKENGDVAHLEAEVSTITKPAKVLKNYWRAAFEDRKCIFVVEESAVDKLLNIVEDPVNRRGDDHEDEQGSFSYYTDEDGEAFTGVEDLDGAEYRVLVRGQSGNVRDYGSETALECPELDEDTSEADLQSFCLFRDDGWCEALEAECVLHDEGGEA